MITVVYYFAYDVAVMVNDLADYSERLNDSNVFTNSVVVTDVFS